MNRTVPQKSLLHEPRTTLAIAFGSLRSPGSCKRFPSLVEVAQPADLRHQTKPLILPTSTMRCKRCPPINVSFSLCFSSVSLSLLACTRSLLRNSPQSAPSNASLALVRFLQRTMALAVLFSRPSLPFNSHKKLWGAVSFLRHVQYSRGRPPRNERLQRT